MAFPPIPGLSVANSPTIPTWSTFHAPTTGGPLTSPDWTTGDLVTATRLDEMGARDDLTSRYGGGGTGVIPGPAGTGLNLSAGAGLSLNIAAGHALMNGVVAYAGAAVTLTDNIARVYLWLSQAGAIVQVNNSLTPPAGAHVFLGSAVTSAGAITSVDFSGVVYAVGGAFHRYTTDAVVPVDNPGRTLNFYQHGAADTWYWNGAVYEHVSSGSSGIVAVADGGTGAGTAAEAIVNLGAAPLSMLTFSPANGTNTLTAVQSNASAILLTGGGGASAAFTLALTVAGSPTVRAGHTWEIMNSTLYGVTIQRVSGANTYLGNGQRGIFTYDGSEVRIVGRDHARYGSTAQSGNWSPTRAEIEADLFSFSAVAGVRTLNYPVTAGWEGRLKAIMTDESTYPAIIQATGEGEAERISKLMPGEVQIFVDDGAGSQRRGVSRPYTRKLVKNFATDANITLSASEALAFLIEMTDTTPNLTADRDVIWDTQQTVDEKFWVVRNRTARAVRFKTAGGGGPTISAGKAAMITCNGTDMVQLTDSADTVAALFGEGLSAAQTASTTVGGTATETTLTGTSLGTRVIPANWFTVGRTVRVTARGHLSTDAATPATLNLRLKFGSTSIVATGDQTPAAGLASRYWEVSVLLTCRTTGATGTVFGQGHFIHAPSAAGDAVIWDMEATAATTIDTTAAQTVDLTADWGGTDVDDTITATHLLVELLG